MRTWSHSGRERGRSRHLVPLGCGLDLDRIAHQGLEQRTRLEVDAVPQLRSGVIDEKGLIDPLLALTGAGAAEATSTERAPLTLPPAAPAPHGSSRTVITKTG